MANEQNDPKRIQETPDEERPAAYPPDWPGIQGRSAEADGEPDTEARSAQEGDEAGSAQVTQAQRELERDVQEPETP